MKTTKQKVGKTCVVLDFYDICEALSRLALEHVESNGRCLKMESISGFYLDEYGEVEILISEVKNGETVSI